MSQLLECKIKLASRPHSAGMLMGSCPEAFITAEVGEAL